MIDEERLTKLGEEFGNGIAKLIRRSTIRAVTVQRVDDNFAYVVLYDGDTPNKVPLSLLNINGSLLKVKPTVDSTALVCNIDGNPNTQFFVAFESVEQIDLAVGESTVNVTSDSITFNGGELNGLVKLRELQNNLDSLKSYCEALKSAVSSGLTAIGVGTSANGGTGASKFNSEMTGKSISFENMENEKIKQ